MGSGGNPDFEQPTVRLGYTTMAVPSSVYDYDVRQRRLTLLKRAPVLPSATWGEYDPDDYEEHRLWATADDGTQVPISIVSRRGSREDSGGGTGPVPVLLYGYGAYEMSIDPYFSIARLSILDRGGAFAIAHVRGGGEMGRHWYDDGKLLHKQHTFSDFIACARHLVATGWTTADRLIAEGGSAGGLLMGAIANQAPECFGGIATAVPFVDPLTSMLDATLPLTVTEYDEWGDPASDPEVYDCMAGYAPYDNVADLEYPPILAETSLNDTRVLYVEPAKWVARLRATAPSADVLLRTEMSAGHGGVSGRYKSWHDRAFSLAWILDRMGLAEETDGCSVASASSPCSPLQWRRAATATTAPRSRRTRARRRTTRSWRPDRRAGPGQHRRRPGPERRRRDHSPRRDREPVQRRHSRVGGTAGDRARRDGRPRPARGCRSGA